MVTMENDMKERNDTEESGHDTEVSEAEEFVDPAETVVMSETDFSEDVGDPSVEVNVEELVKKVAEDGDADRKKEIRRKLEELAEEKSFEDTYAVDFDD